VAENRVNSSMRDGDRDGAFSPVYIRRIRAMRIRDHPTAPRSPWQNGHVERLIGSIRREALDHLIVFDEAQLRRMLKNYASYYNQVRTHLSLKKDVPDSRRPQKFGRIATIPILGGLHHQYVQVWLLTKHSRSRTISDRFWTGLLVRSGHKSLNVEMQHALI
jgi:hypothetical protein